MADTKGEKDTIIVSYLGLRRTIGTVGIALPLALLIYGLTLNNNGIEQSISQFYHTPMRDFFVGSLCIIGFFLMSYRGYEIAPDEYISDRTLGWLAGGAAILVAFLPTDIIPAEYKICSKSSVTGSLHFGFAAFFLFILGVFSFFKFTRSDTPRLKWDTDKNIRMWIFRVCGGTIFGCLILIGIGKALICIETIPDPQNTWVFWTEAVAVWAFGVSWLVKGTTLKNLQDLQSMVMPRK